MYASEGSATKHSDFLAMVLLIFVSMTITSAQVTFNRQWVRGKYPGSDDGGYNMELQQTGLATLQTYNGLIKPDGESDYIPVFMNAQMLEEIFKRIKDPAVGRAAGFAGNIKK